MYNPQLDTFLRVAEAGSFNKAAEEMFITPPAVIKQINLLERDLELKLFVRNRRGLMLTGAGKSLYHDTKRIIQYSRESIARAREAMQKENQDDHVIRIGTSPMTPGQFLIELWSKIQKRCPNVKFQLVPFENTIQIARDVLCNLGQNIDIVAGPFDQRSLEHWKCAGLELFQTPIRCGVSVHHPLSSKSVLKTEDLYGEDFMLICRGWNRYLDVLRDDLWQRHPQINVVDFDFFSLDVFNQCENSRCMLMAIDAWEGAHPLLKILPVEWDYRVPYGLLHAPEPSAIVQDFLNAVQMAAANIPRS